MKTFFKYYGIGILYGTSRSFYFLDKVNDSTYTDKGKIYHPLTYSKFISNSFNQIMMSTVFWPAFICMDIEIYEKSRWGIKDNHPPFPFHNFSWKDEN